MDHGDAAYWDCGGDPTPNEIARYNATKRLAEMAWQAILSDPGYVAMKPSEAAEEAWVYAEFMRIASEKRRPK